MVDFIFKINQTKPSFWAVFIMGRIEARPFLVGRRTALKTGGILALGLALSALGVGVHEQLKEKPKGKPLTEVEKNLKSALELMDSYDDQRVQDAVNFYKSDQNQNVQFMRSEHNSIKGPARVVPAFEDQKRKVKIALELDQFADQQFNLREATISLFEAFYVYQQAERDPKKFSNYPYYQASLKHDAENISSQIFSEK